MRNILFEVQGMRERYGQSKEMGKGEQGNKTEGTVDFF